MSQEMTAQQVFDSVLNGLRLQGKAAVFNGNCMYRAPDGCKCAFGILIKDDEYDPEMENCSAPLVLARFPKLFHLQQHSQLLDALQYAHDSYLAGNDMTAWEQEMYDISRRYGLRYTRSSEQLLPLVDPINMHSQSRKA